MTSSVADPHRPGVDLLEAASIRSAVDLPDPDGPDEHHELAVARRAGRARRPPARRCPAYSMVACSKRTSDMGRAPRGRKLVAESAATASSRAQAGMGRRIGSEVVEAEQAAPTIGCSARRAR